MPKRDKKRRREKEESFRNIASSWAGRGIMFGYRRFYDYRFADSVLFTTLAKEEYLERLLIYNKGSIERTKQKLDKLCTCTNLMPEFLQNYDIRNEFKPLFTVNKMGVLSQPTKDNYRVFVSYLTGDDDPKYQLVDAYRFMIVEALSQRIKKIHLLSGSKFFDTIITFVKQSLSGKLKERLVIHPNVESLQNHFPKEQLPKELGGGGPSMRVLCDLSFKEFNSDEHVGRVKFMEKLGTDEAYRSASTFNEEYSGMPGSFKTLCVD